MNTSVVGNVKVFSQWHKNYTVQKPELSLMLTGMIKPAYFEPTLRTPTLHADYMYQVSVICQNLWEEFAPKPVYVHIINDLPNTQPPRDSYILPSNFVSRVYKLTG